MQRARVNKITVKQAGASDPSRPARSPEGLVSLYLSSRNVLVEPSPVSYLAGREGSLAPACFAVILFYAGPLRFCLHPHAGAFRLIA